MASIPKVLHDYLNTAFPQNVCLVSSVQPDGYAQVSPKGSLQVYDDETLAYWDRGKGSTHDAVQDGSKVTVYYRNSELGAAGTKLLPAGGIARFYGTAKLVANGSPEAEKIYASMVQPERDRDPEKKGSGVLIKVERAEDLGGNPLNLD